MEVRAAGGAVQRRCGVGRRLQRARVRLCFTSWIVDLAFSARMGMGRRPKHVGTLTLRSTTRGHPALSLVPFATATATPPLFHTADAAFGSATVWPLSWFRVCLAERSRRRACVWACPSTLRAVTDSECTQPGGFPGRGGSGSVGVPRRASRPRSRFARAVCHCHHTHIPWSQDLSTLALRTSRPPSSTQRPPRASALSMEVNTDRRHKRRRKREDRGHA